MDTTTMEQTTEPEMTTTVEPCFPRNDCLGHYTCDNETEAQICLPGFTGIDCLDRILSQENDPDCPPGECRNGGTCFNETCCCVPGYTGVNCEAEILECLSFPCQNDGTCNEMINGYTCNCLPGKRVTSQLVAFAALPSR